MTEQYPNRESLLEMAESFMGACVLGAAAELDLFTLLARQPATAEQVTIRIDGDRRCTEILLDAAVSLNLLDKADGLYRTPEPLQPWLVEDAEETLLPMIRHRMNVLRGWVQLPWMAKAGVPFPRQLSIRGILADR